MGIFDLFGGILIGAIIDPTSSYEEMQKKIESNEEETINDDNYDTYDIEAALEEETETELAA